MFPSADSSCRSRLCRHGVRVWRCLAVPLLRWSLLLMLRRSALLALLADLQGLLAPRHVDCRQGWY